MAWKKVHVTISYVVNDEAKAREQVEKGKKKFNELGMQKILGMRGKPPFKLGELQTSLKDSCLELSLVAEIPDHKKLIPIKVLRGDKIKPI